MSSSGKTVLKEVVAETNGQVVVLTLNRPEALNALNQELLADLARAVEAIGHDRDVRSVIFTGSGAKSFVAGADIKEMKDLSPPEALAMAERGQRVMQMIESLPQATIAAVNGFALGGGFELALACDFIVAADNAKFGLPEVSLGLIPGYGGTQRLARSIGKSAAKMVALSGNMYSAAEMKEFGAVVRVEPQAELMPSVVRLAKTIASRGPRALALAKRAISEGYDLDQSAGLRLECELFSETFRTQDHNEGIAAFIEKRAPQFKGN